MFGAVDVKNRVVWGVGCTVERAKHDASQNWEDKSESIREEGFPVLEYLPFVYQADLTGDGFELFEYIDFGKTDKNVEEGQQELF